MFVVLTLEVEDGCEHCDKDNVSSWIETVLEQSHSDIKLMDPSPTYKPDCVLVYDKVSDVVADLEEELSEILIAGEPVPDDEDEEDDDGS